ncbi:hypothetical protein ACFLY2_02175 [Patescibacteria group bacterium]
MLTSRSISVCIPVIIAFAGIQSVDKLKFVREKKFVKAFLVLIALVANVVVVFNVALLVFVHIKEPHHISVAVQAYPILGFTSTVIIKFLSKVPHLQSSVLKHILYIDFVA